jgi:hypothetical protein
VRLVKADLFADSDAFKVVLKSQPIFQPAVWIFSALQRGLYEYRPMVADFADGEDSSAPIIIAFGKDVKIIRVVGFSDDEVIKASMI